VSHARRWQNKRWDRRPTAFQLAIGLHKAQLRECSELLPPDEFEALLDIFERMQAREQHRFARWRDAT
jgi:hypothetical protein